MYSMLERRGKGRFHVVSMWNTRGVFAGLHQFLWFVVSVTQFTSLEQVWR